MKYMGSKRWMLQNGLGEILKKEASNSVRFIDLFSGSTVVTSYIARQHSIPCYAYDIQSFSVCLANSIIRRTAPLNADQIWEKWIERARNRIKDSTSELPTSEKFTRSYVSQCRIWCEKQIKHPITRVYGGYYFSPVQTLWIDALRATLPKIKDEKYATLSALIRAASICAAAPGHTAQPFQPTRNAKKFIRDAWGKSITEKVKSILDVICRDYALCKGEAFVMDANKAANNVKNGDLVFIDPPYSGVHYSRFYHVLETIARGKCSDVTGKGRYPTIDERPRSKYSIGTQSQDALDQLLEIISKRGARGVLTFPLGECSNGLSGEKVKNTASKYFKVGEKIVTSRFSTLGGNMKKSKTNNIRAARKVTQELILILSPLLN